MIGDYVYYVIGGYFIIAGVLGIGMYLIWLTIRFRIKLYNLEELYGRTGARIFCIIFGLLIIVLGYVVNTFLNDLF